MVDLKRFERRVRWMRAWRGLAVGLVVGGALAALWAVADVVGLWYTSWAQLGLVAGAGALVGAAIGFFSRVSQADLARSIDRRAGLEDRLTTALEVDDDGFGGAVRQDAASRFQGLEAKKLYPVRVGKLQGGALALTVLAASIFLLGNTPSVLNPERRAEQEAMKKQAEGVERILEPMRKPEERAKMDERDKKLVAEAMKFQRDLEKARLSKEQALQRANQLAQDAEKLSRERIDFTAQNLQQAETAMDQLNRKLDAASVPRGTLPDSMQGRPRTAEEAAMRAQALDAAAQNLKAQMGEAQRRLSELQEQIERAKAEGQDTSALERQKDALEMEIAQMQKDLQSIQLSKEAMETFRKMMQDPAWKEIQELARKLQESNEQAEQTGRQKLTKEQMEEMRQRLEELAEQLQDPEAMREYLEALKEAMKNPGGT